MGDNRQLRPYAQAMEDGRPFIRLKLDIEEAIELGEFVGAFTALASEYDRYMRGQRPGETPEATLYVKEVRTGCIEADLVPMAACVLGAIGTVVSQGIQFADGFNTVSDFVERLGNRLRSYTRPGGRVADAGKNELKDFGDQVAAIANAPGSTMRLAAMHVERGEEKISAAFEFDTSQAREIQARLEEHKRELDHSSRADYERVVMTFVRSDKRDATVGKRSGELVEIPAISDRPRPLIYASALAEAHIKREVKESAYTKAFVVDVNVEFRNGRPIAYAITDVHQIFDIEDD